MRAEQRDRACTRGFEIHEAAVVGTHSVEIPFGHARVGKLLPRDRFPRGLCESSEADRLRVERLAVDVSDRDRTTV